MDVNTFFSLSLDYKGASTPKRFVVRLKKRALVHRGLKRDCCELGRVLPCPFQSTLIKYEQGEEKVRTLWYNAVSVRLPDRDERLFMVVVKGFGQEPMMLLTTVGSM